MNSLSCPLATAQLAHRLETRVARRRCRGAARRAPSAPSQRKHPCDLGARGRPRPSTSPIRRRLAVAAAATILAVGAGTLVAARRSRSSDRGADPRHERLPRSHPEQHHERRGRRGGACRRGEAAARQRTRTRSSPPRATSSAPRPSSRSSRSDKPTIDALNAAGLEVSAVGNHELDQGYDDLVNRVMAPYDADDEPLRRRRVGVHRREPEAAGDGRRAVPATWIREFGDVEVGFVGAVTEELPVAGEPRRHRRHRRHGDRRARSTPRRPTLVAEGADLVVMLVHEGAPSTNCATMDESGTVGARSSTPSRPTSTRSCRDTRTSRTTAPSRSREWARWSRRHRPPGRLGRPVRHEPQPARLHRRRRDRRRSRRRRRTLLPLESPSYVALYPADPTVARIVDGRRGRRRGARCATARPDRRRVQPGADADATGRAPRTAAASRRSAISSPRCSSGRPKHRSPAQRRSRS